MMASAVENTFDSYLSLKLQELDTDEGVFGSYIKSILEGDETLEEKLEALEGILSEITQVDIGKHCREIVERWNSSQLIASCQKAAEDRQAEDDVEEKLVKLLESTQAPSSQPQRQYTDEERRIRQAILAQYSQTSDKESDDEGGGTGGGGGGFCQRWCDGRRRLEREGELSVS
ncbi:hypothetical protein LSTR_LSTR003515 [Laodelphax striatellus]|uniref:Coiled-coil domain-containing protein 43 n=1 Tax=Laodelphax striatellus TaxID=195883 RepID=A0A482X946_LAOST|nr:hypothetical protein LSTR_LSTR003515 [Laodelphax striatellus]